MCRWSLISIPHAAAAKEPKKEEKKFVTIDLEEKPKEKEAIVLSEEPLRVKKPVKREEKKEFEFFSSHISDFRFQ